MAAFQLARKMGARSLELDVHETCDGRLAVIHDDDLKRVAGRRQRIKDLAWSELTSFDVGSWFDKKFSGERVPSLEKVLHLSRGRLKVHIEIKAGSRRYPGIEGKVAGLIADFKAWDWTVVSSFDHQALALLRPLEARLRLGYLRGLVTMKTALREIAEIKAESLHMSLRQAGPAEVKAAHGRGLKLLVYTVNQGKDLARMEAMGVDGVFTNYPDLSTATNSVGNRS